MPEVNPFPASAVRGATSACAACGGPSRSLGYRSQIRSCSGCGHRFMIADVPDVESLYGPSYDGFRDDPLFRSRARDLLVAHLVDRLPDGARVLDVGCGNGTTLQVATDLGFRAHGLDISEAAVASCRRRGLSASVDDFAARVVEPSSFDLVTFWDVLEHLKAPREFIEAAAAALRPGGWLLVKVPHHRWLSTHLAATVPRLSRSILATPAHLQFFSRSSLQRLLVRDFEKPQWLQVDELRSRARGGSLLRKASRLFVRTVQHVSGDGTLLLLARRRIG